MKILFKLSNWLTNDHLGVCWLVSLYNSILLDFIFMNNYNKPMSFYSNEVSSDGYCNHWLLKYFTQSKANLGRSLINVVVPRCLLLLSMLEIIEPWGRITGSRSRFAHQQTEAGQADAARGRDGRRGDVAYTSKGQRLL